MIRRLSPFIIVLLFACGGGAAQAEEPLSQIAFGSCARQGKPQPIWEAIVKTEPDVFLFIGDNIYGDTTDIAELKAKWEMLGSEPGYQKLKETCPILAVWDDHDYGANDAGHEYPKKQESQQIFLDFFEEPADSPRRQHEGIYWAKTFGPEGKRVQVILLDTRYFRSPLSKSGRKYETGSGVHGGYAPNLSPEATVLGETQWQWLEEQLQQPAEVRIIASSIQVIPDQHWWEKWGNFPLERERLFRLIDQTDAEGVIFISGDRHSAEISKLDPGTGYPLYDVTSSSLNQPHEWRNELNEHRVGLIYPESNFGTILIDWEQENPEIRVQVRGEAGDVVLQDKVRVSQLQPTD